MYRLKHPDILASEIADLLNSRLEGDDFVVNSPSYLPRPKEKSFIFCIAGDEARLNGIVGISDLLVITDLKTLRPRPGLAFIFIENPRLSYMEIINELFITYSIPVISKTAVIDEQAQLGSNVGVGENSIITGDVEIGQNTIIYNNVVIRGPVRIGTGCVIRDNCTIGSEAFEFIKTLKARLVKVPCVGEIRIESNVLIGSNSTVERGIYDSTYIADDVKIDDLVHIGASCQIGKGTQIMAGCILSRNVKIGYESQISPNSCIREGMNIGAKVIVGLGSVVVKDIKDGMLVYGNPAAVKNSSPRIK